MDAKTEITKLWKDVQASAREFASLGLASGVKALEVTGAKIKTLEEKLKGTAEKLRNDGGPEATVETPSQTIKQ